MDSCLHSTQVCCRRSTRCCFLFINHSGILSIDQAMLLTGKKYVILYRLDWSSCNTRCFKDHFYNLEWIKCGRDTLRIFANSKFTYFDIQTLKLFVKHLGIRNPINVLRHVCALKAFISVHIKFLKSGVAFVISCQYLVLPFKG